MATAISTAFVESAVNQIVSRRFVKNQQMRWTERGSHHLLQIRTLVSNEHLALSSNSRGFRFGDECVDHAVKAGTDPQKQLNERLTFFVGDAV